MKFYRKQPIEAEQFDGSQDNVFGYSISHAYITDTAYIFVISDSEDTVEIGDWIVKEADEIKVMADEEFHKQYAGLPVIPENVAYIIKQAKKGDYKLGWVFHATYLGIWRVSVGNWIRTHADTVARAWLDGYQVEEDK